MNSCAVLPSRRLRPVPHLCLCVAAKPGAAHSVGHFFHGSHFGIKSSFTFIKQLSLNSPQLAGSIY